MDGKYQAKVSDFGLARQTATGYYQATESALPIRWTAPGNSFNLNYLYLSYKYQKY